MLKLANFRRAHLKVLLLLIVFCGLISYYIKTKYLPNEIEIAKRCYLHNGRNPNGTGKALTYFEDLLAATKKPKHDQGIFFIETKCSDSGIADLKPRFACSIEAAAKGNPTRDVFVVFPSPIGMPRHEQDWSSTIKALMEYPNVHFRNVQLQRLCEDTPLEGWIESFALFKSIARYEHASDVIRVLLLYKYGGTYIDLDYMMVRPLDVIKRNWIAIQIENCLNNAVFDFRHSGIGRIVINEVLSDLADGYNPNIWDHNGPHSFQRVLKRICDQDDLAKVDRRQCRGVKIYPSKWFYPLFGRDSLKFFDPNLTQSVLNQTKGIMGFHFWNSGSKTLENITMRNATAYDVFAEKHCPRIYARHSLF